VNVLVVLYAIERHARTDKVAKLVWVHNFITVDQLYDTALFLPYVSISSLAL
jgi:hypothetical protein